MKWFAHQPCACIWCVWVGGWWSSSMMMIMENDDRMLYGWFFFHNPIGRSVKSFFSIVFFFLFSRQIMKKKIFPNSFLFSLFLKPCGTPPRLMDSNDDDDDRTTWWLVSFLRSTPYTHSVPSFVCVCVCLFK